MIQPCSAARFCPFWTERAWAGIGVNNSVAVAVGSRYNRGMAEQALPGGRSFGAVHVGDEVRRPPQPWTATVHTVLRHLEDVGFDGAPRARGFDDRGRERLTYLPGQTLGETSPWPDWVRSDDALAQVGGWLRRLHDATATYRPAAEAVWFTGRPWQPGLLIGHLDASPWNAVWVDGDLVGFVDWDTASPCSREQDLAFSALTWVPLLTVRLAEEVGFADASERHRRLHLFLDAYGYTGDRGAIRDAIIGRVERNVAMIREWADGGEPTFQRMLPWAADLERSGAEVAELPDEFWQSIRGAEVR
jgi:hypothetical protein